MKKSESETAKPLKEAEPKLERTEFKPEAANSANAANAPKSKRRLSAYLIVLIVSLCMVLSGGIFGGIVQTGFGKVTVSGVTFPMRDGQWLAADLFKPKSATDENKAPLIVVVAGFQRSRETQSGISLELARRGFVVISIDPYSQGDSSSSIGRESAAVASTEGYGAFDLINYIYDSGTLNYVDINRIGVTGHSAGGNAAFQAAVKFGKEAVDNNGVSKVHSVYISGYVISIDSSIRYSKSNMGMDYALYDEGAFRNKDAGEEQKPTSDMTIAVESHDFVNSVLTGDAVVAEDAPVELGKIYGNPVARTMRQVFNTPTIHALQPYVSAANSALLNFFEVAMDMDSGIAPSSTIWWLKEFATTLALIGALMFIVPFAILLLKIPFFATVKHPIPAPIKRRTTRRKIVFIFTFSLSALVAALTYIPMSQLTATLFPDATASIMTWFFPQRMNNAVMLWAILNGIAGMIIFLGCFFGTYGIKTALHRWSKKPLKATATADATTGAGAPIDTAGLSGGALFSAKAKNFFRAFRIKGKAATLKTFGTDAPEPLSIEPWGLKIKPRELFKTFLLALCVVGGFYMLLNIGYFLFHVDFRFLFVVAARPLNLRVLLQALMYVPLFFIFYLANSIRANGNMREAGQKKWVGYLISGLSNSAGLIAILAIQYIVFATTGTVKWGETPEMTQWLYVNILFGLIPLMFVLPFFHKWFFNATGKTWLGPMVMCMIFITMMINNSVAYIPLP
jgi:hypothetical protein